MFQKFIYCVPMDCHSERSEESHCRPTGWRSLAPLGMTQGTVNPVNVRVREGAGEEAASDSNTPEHNWRLRCGIALACAAILFAFLFGGIVLHFWLQLAASVLALVAMAFFFEPLEMRRLFRAPPHGRCALLVYGALSAVVLYGIFAAGKWAATAVLSQADRQIGGIYALGRGAPAWAIAGLLLFVVGPGEEIFWRGYVQRRLAREFGWRGVLLSVLAYGAVHLVSGNPILILAALVCGTFWAALFAWRGSMWINMASHALWAVAVFVLQPLNGSG